MASLLTRIKNVFTDQLPEPEPPSKEPVYLDADRILQAYRVGRKTLDRQLERSLEKTPESPALITKIADQFSRSISTPESTVDPSFDAGLRDAVAHWKGHHLDRVYRAQREACRELPKQRVYSHSMEL